MDTNNSTHTDSHDVENNVHVTGATVTDGDVSTNVGIDLNFDTSQLANAWSTGFQAQSINDHNSNILKDNENNLLNDGNSLLDIGNILKDNENSLLNDTNQILNNENILKSEENYIKYLSLEKDKLVANANLLFKQKSFKYLVSFGVMGLIFYYTKKGKK